MRNVATVTGALMAGIVGGSLFATGLVAHPPAVSPGTTATQPSGQIIAAPPALGGIVTGPGGPAIAEVFEVLQSPFVAISVYLPTFLVDAFGLERADAAARAAGFVVLATLMRPVGGTLADRWGAAPVLNGTFLAVALLPIVLAFGPGFATITVAFLGIAAALGLGNGAVFKLVAEEFPHETGTVTGLAGAAGGLGGFFPPILMGLVLDATGAYSIGFMLLSEIALGCLIVNLLVMQRRATSLMTVR